MRHRLLTPFERKVVEHVNLLTNFKVNPDDCSHVGDVIFHLQGSGMKLSSVTELLLQAAKEVENAPS